MKRVLLALAVAGAALLWVTRSTGLAGIGAVLLAASWALPPMMITHGFQLFLSALAWRRAMDTPAITSWRMLRTRWIRESVNSLLPVAQLGGQVVGARLLIGAGIPTATAAAGTILDLLMEGSAQLVFTLVGIALLLGHGTDQPWRRWAVVGVGVMAMGLLGFILAQRLGLLRLIEKAVESLARHLPALSAWSLAGLHAQMLHLQSNRRNLITAVAWHTVSWTLGGAEVWIALHALGQDVSLVQAIIIESLGMVARSAGFVVPGAVGIQEGGFVLAGGLFGVPPQAALALSLLKRLREVAVGLPGLAAWRLWPPVDPASQAASPKARAGVG